MKRVLILSALLICGQALLAGSLMQIEKISASRDTLINAVEDKIIEEIIDSKPGVKNEKVVYLSQVTRYGFKDLFKNYTYNPSLPYSAQINPYAENYMQDYLRSHTKNLRSLQETSAPYFNFIDEVLSTYGLPHELKYLAVIESNLKSTALSSAGARGPWQFMDYTARQYGLQVNAMVDDRIDYAKSTHAASKYLLSLYKDLKDWLLVIAAYNGGPGRVYSAIKKAGSRNFWDLQYYLPEESRNHVKKFIATHYIMESSPDKNGTFSSFDYSRLNNINLAGDVAPGHDSANLVQKTISGRFKADIVAVHILMEENIFRRLNPGMDHLLSQGKEFTLKLPADKMNLFEENRNVILNECVQALLGNVRSDSRTVYKKR